VDPTFGPVVLFGQGGVAVEVLADRVVGLPPLNQVLAKEMVSRTRVSKMLKAFRDRQAVDEDALAQALERLSLLAIELPEVVELDINPLLADHEGVLALDARIRLSAAPRRKLAIHPYPSNLDTTFVTGEGEVVQIRPVRPQDAPRLTDLVERTSADDVHLRFRGGLRHLPDALAARLSQIDYDREMALAAIGQDGDVLGVSRLVSDPEGETAEFALLVRTDHQQHGLGRHLLQAIIDYGRARGLRQVWGEVMAGNERMLNLAAALGFRRTASEDVSLVRVVKALA
jgi:acetyltransferase